MERNFRLNWQDVVSEAIKRRKEQRMTQEYLALLAGVSKPTLNAFEQGKDSLTLKSVLKILKALGMG
jgi:transcriptional regulator with XRE-family HTH domain